MKKRLLCLALALAAVVSCYGCGQEKPEVVETEAESRPVLEIYAGQSEKRESGFLAEAYEEQNGEAGINIHLIPDSEYTQQMMRIKNHEVPADCIFSGMQMKRRYGGTKRFLKIYHPGTRTATRRRIMRRGTEICRKRRHII